MTDRGYFSSSSSFDDILKVSEPSTKPALTKIACTLGPCSRDLETLEKMLEAGMTCARINVIWGSKDYHQETGENLARAMRHTKLPCALMLDTEGLEMHIRNPNGGTIQFEKGSKVTLICDSDLELSKDYFPLSIPSFEGMDLVPGIDVFVGQYLFTGSETTSVYLTISEVLDHKTVECVVQDNATLAGIEFIAHFSGACTTMPILSEKDIEAIRTFGKDHKIHFVSLSYCRSAEDVRDCRSFLDRVGLTSTQIIAKIENVKALKNFASILNAADGIMFSRGYIGLDIASEKIFRVQKYIIDECNRACKPIIVTRVLDTMTENPRPTRAEATDIANLVLNGVDCFILGAETFRGKHPVATIQLIQAISKQAEKTFDSELFSSAMSEEALSHNISEHEKLEGLAASAVRAAALLRADLIIVFTVDGKEALVLSKFRPGVPILSVVFPRLVSNGVKWTFSGESAARQLLIARSCIPILADPSMGGVATTKGAQMEGSMLSRAIAYAYSKKWVKLGSKVIVSQHAKRDTDFTFEEAGLIKILAINEQVLDAAIENYNVHSHSVITLKKQMFIHQRRPTFKGIPLNEMPVTIPLRSSTLCHSIPEKQQISDDIEDEDGQTEEIDDMPTTPLGYDSDLVH